MQSGDKRPWEVRRGLCHVTVERRTVLHQFIRPLIGAGLCSGPSWISARERSHFLTGLEWAIWVPSVRMRREDRYSISSHPLADLGGNSGMMPTQ
jgi:hypothetical protein